MTVTTMSSRAFNQDTGAAKKAAAAGPVIITDRGRPAHVLLSIEDFRALSGSRISLLDLIGMAGEEDIAFDPPKLRLVPRPADLS